MTSEQEKAWVRECREGNTRAFEPLVNEYKKPVYNAALRMVGDPDDAADITQSVFVKAFTKLHTYDERYKLFSWLYRMAINESINFLKEKRRFQSLDEDVAAPEELPEAHVDGERLNKEIQEGLMQLKPDYRAVLVLKHFHDLSYEEVSRVLDVPEKTVKSRLFTARQLLKDVLSKRGIR